MKPCIAAVAVLAFATTLSAQVIYDPPVAPAVEPRISPQAAARIRALTPPRVIIVVHVNEIHGPVRVEQSIVGPGWSGVHVQAEPAVHYFRMSDLAPHRQEAELQDRVRPEESIRRPPPAPREPLEPGEIIIRPSPRYIAEPGEQV